LAALNPSGTGKRDGLAESAETPRELFAKCVDCERKLNDWGAWERLKESPPGDVPAQDISLEANLAQLKQSALRGARYRDLVELLKKCSDNEARLYVLACWLKQEGVCQPKDFLPKDVFQEFTREARRLSEKFSPTDWRYGALVDAWLPYFKKLIGDLRRIRKTNRRAKDLMDAGYDQQTINLVVQMKTRSAIKAACDWLANRQSATAGTLRNAYVRIEKSKRHNSGITRL